MFTRGRELGKEMEFVTGAVTDGFVSTTELFVIGKEWLDIKFIRGAGREGLEARSEGLLGPGVGLFVITTALFVMATELFVIDDEELFIEGDSAFGLWVDIIEWLKPRMD